LPSLAEENVGFWLKADVLGLLVDVTTDATSVKSRVYSAAAEPKASGINDMGG